jgi:predicted ester cyclase
MVGPATGGAPTTTEATAANVRAVRRFWDGFNAHALDVWDEVCAATFRNHDPGLPTPDADLPTLKRTIGGLLAAFPDLASSEDALLAAGDAVAVRRTLRGTHTGAFLGIAPTGRAVTFTGIWLARLGGGRLEEQWVSFDALGLLRQLGAIPSPDAPAGTAAPTRAPAAARPSS